MKARQKERLANTLVTIWFLVTMAIIMGAWFGLIPPSSN